MPDLLTIISRIDAIDPEITRLLRVVDNYVFVLEQDAQIIKAKALFTRFSSLTTKQRDLLEILPGKLYEIAQCQTHIEALQDEINTYQQEIHNDNIGLIPQAVALNKRLNDLLNRLHHHASSLQHLKELYNHQRAWLYQHTQKEIAAELQRYDSEIQVAEEWSHNHFLMSQLSTITNVDAKEIKVIYAYKHKLKQIQKHLDEIAVILSEHDVLHNVLNKLQTACKTQIEYRDVFLNWVQESKLVYPTHEKRCEHNPLLVNISHLPNAKKNVVISPRGALAGMIHTPIPNIWFTESSIRINPFRDGHYRVSTHNHGLSYTKQANKLLTPVTTLFAILPNNSLEKPFTLHHEINTDESIFLQQLENLWREHFTRQFAHKAILLLHLHRELTRRDVELTINLKGLEGIKNFLHHISHKEQIQLLRAMLITAHIMGQAAGFITYRDHDRRFSAHKYTNEINKARRYLLEQTIVFDDGHKEPLLKKEELRILLAAQYIADPVEIGSQETAYGIEKIWSRWVFVR